MPFLGTGLKPGVNETTFEAKPSGDVANGHNYVNERAIAGANPSGVEHCHAAAGYSILSHVEYPFPPVGIVGAADGKNRRAFLFLKNILLCFANAQR